MLWSSRAQRSQLTTKARVRVTGVTDRVCAHLACVLASTGDKQSGPGRRPTMIFQSCFSTNANTPCENRVMNHDCDSIGGQSGSPMYNNGTFRVRQQSGSSYSHNCETLDICFQCVQVLYWMLN